MLLIAMIAVTMLITMFRELSIGRCSYGANSRAAEPSYGNMRYLKTLILPAIRAAIAVTLSHDRYAPSCRHDAGATTVSRQYALLK